MDLFALATLPAAADEAGGPPSIKFYELRDNLRARDEASERQAARSNAAKTCKAERGTTAESRRAFEQKYGTNGNKANAYGKCVFQAADQAADKADAADARITAARQCADERGTNAASRKAFADKYATNWHKSNAFGKCVSKQARVGN